MTRSHNARILVTGGAGFIGAALAHRLLARGDAVHVVDNLNDYYAVSLKKARLALLLPQSGFTFQHGDIADRQAMQTLFQHGAFDIVVNLAAQAGVRYSFHNPSVTIDSNMVGFGNILENCATHAVSHLIYASSSSVYGGNTKLPFAETDPVDQPISLYAASKKANELMAHSYSHLYDLPATGLRFFTVYGPWGRPDMAFFKFTRLMLEGEKIPVYNQGDLARDFTYIDDIVEGMVRVIDAPPLKRDAASGANQAVNNAAKKAVAHRLYNIGNGSEIKLKGAIQALENALGVKANYDLLPMQPGDMQTTCADIRQLKSDFDFSPSTDITTGLQNFVRWYRDYYKVR